MRLLVSYTIPKSNQHGFVGIEIPNYNLLTADQIASRIQFDIVDRYQGTHYSEIVITMVKLLGEIEESHHTPMYRRSMYGTGCIVCGEDHGTSGLPCPNMSPMA